MSTEDSEEALCEEVCDSCWGSGYVDLSSMNLGWKDGPCMPYIVPCSCPIGQEIETRKANE